MTRPPFSLALLLLLAACGLQGREQHPSSFVDATLVVPRLQTEIRYAGRHNFVGRPVDGYEKPICLVTRQAAAALAQVQNDLAAQGLGLKVFDCYRPRRAVADFVRWASDPNATQTKPEFYPDVDKSRLFKEGYIAERSGHSRGSTVDITLVRRQGAAVEELDMGSPFDLFSPRSWPTDTTVSPEAQANRKILATAMERRGFKPYPQEWWHFTLKDEPFPGAYFDFPVR